MKHVVIIPARNEERHIRQTLESLVAQTLALDRIYVVDDGSSDQTAALVEQVAASHASVRLVRRQDRGYRKMGGGVVETFNAAYELCKHEPFDYVSKIDADLVFPPAYFASLTAFLDDNPDVAAASGVIDDVIDGALMRQRLPPDHVPGPLKTLRKRVFDEIGGFMVTLGWDVIDLVKMRSLGYRTARLDSLVVTQLRQHASAEGTWKGKAQWGRGAHAIGSHPLFVLARGAYRMLEPPYVVGGVAFWWGYLRAVLERAPQIDDRELVSALRREQLYRLLHRNRLPPPTS